MTLPFRLHHVHHNFNIIFHTVYVDHYILHTTFQQHRSFLQITLNGLNKDKIMIG